MQFFGDNYDNFGKLYLKKFESIKEYESYISRDDYGFN